MIIERNATIEYVLASLIAIRLENLGKMNAQATKRFSSWKRSGDVDLWDFMDGLNFHEAEEQANILCYEIQYLMDLSIELEQLRENSEVIKSIKIVHKLGLL